MPHYAHINEDNIVDRVIVADKAFINSGAVGDPARWVPTSYNTAAGVHTDPATGARSRAKTKAFRKNFAGPGYRYAPSLDAFIPPYPKHRDGEVELDTIDCVWKIKEGPNV